MLALTTLGAVLALLAYLPIIQRGYANMACAESTSSLTTEKPQPPREFRGVWIATVENLDWPSRAGLSAAVQQQEFTKLLDQVKQMCLNAIVVQIKPVADAFYPSQYGPWSAYLSGTQGKDPGYNPLAFMVSEAHRRNLEFHAWFNPYRLSLHNDINQLAPNHPARQHPDWIVSYGGRLYYNPGLPAVRAFVVSSILEVVTNYAIDAVHMDDYFYPYPVAGQNFPDDASFQKFNSGHFAKKADWRRDNVNQLIQQLSVSMKQIKPHIKFGISPFGVWRNKATDPTGSDTRATQNYDDLYADTRTWIRNNWLDYIAPQLYWPIGFAPAAYEKLVDWWSKEVGGRNVHLYIGHAVYKIGSNTPPAWTNPEEMVRQIQLNRNSPQVKGSIFFRLRSLLDNPLGFKDRLINDLYKQVAIVPEMPWLPARR